MTLFGHGHGAALINLLLLSKRVYKNGMYFSVHLSYGDNMALPKFHFPFPLGINGAIIRKSSNMLHKM